jgi:hypothetical protein
VACPFLRWGYPGTPPTSLAEQDVLSGVLMMTTITSTHEATSWQLSQRLHIFCPHTGLPVDTGHELIEVDRLAPQAQMLIDCIECGEDHGWVIEDAFLQ